MRSSNLSGQAGQRGWPLQPPRPLAAAFGGAGTWWFGLAAATGLAGFLAAVRGRRAGGLRGPLAAANMAVYEPEVERAPVKIDPVYGYADAVAEPVALAGTATGERVACAVVAVAVVGQRVERHEPLSRQRQALHEDPEGLHARNHCVHLLADPRRHEEQEFQLDEFPLGRLRSAFEVRAFLAELDEAVGGKPLALGEGGLQDRLALYAVAIPSVEVVGDLAGF